MGSRILDQYGNPYGGLYLNDGMALPHVIQFNTVLSDGWNNYFHGRYDESRKQSREDSLAMKRDCEIQGMIQERKLAVASLPWHIETDDDKDPLQKQVAQHIQNTIENFPFFRKYLFAALEKIWYGRYGIQYKWKWDYLGGIKTLTCARWLPVNGDKIGHSQDHTPFVMLWPAAAGDYEDRAEVGYTNSEGGAFVRIKGWLRDRFTIFRHVVEDADFMEMQAAEAVHGVGIRSMIYWLDFIRREWLSNLCDFIERAGLGAEIWYYQEGNPDSKSEVTAAAKAHVGNRAKLIVPIRDNQRTPSVERMEVPMSGADLLIKLQDRASDIINRFINGQHMSSNSKASGGLGNEAAAEFQQDTKRQIRNWDAGNFEEELTGNAENPGLVYLIQRWTFPGTLPGSSNPKGFRCRFKFALEDLQSSEKLANAQTIVQMGKPVKTEEVYAAGGFSKPADDDDVIMLPQQPPGMPPGGPDQPGPDGQPGPSGQPTGEPEIVPDEEEDEGPAPEGHGYEPDWLADLDDEESDEQGDEPRLYQDDGESVSAPKPSSPAPAAPKTSLAPKPTTTLAKPLGKTKLALSAQKPDWSHGIDNHADLAKVHRDDPKAAWVPVQTKSGNQAFGNSLTGHVLHVPNVPKLHPHDAAHAHIERLNAPPQFEKYTVNSVIDPGEFRHEHHKESLQSLLPHSPKPQTVLKLTNPGPGAKVHPAHSTPFSFTMEGKSPTIRNMQQTLKVTPDGELVLSNDLLLGKKNRKEKPGQMMRTGKAIHENFGKQVEAAQQHGVDKISTVAGRGGEMIGYKLWPKLGFDAPIPGEIKHWHHQDFAPGGKFENAETVLDLYQTREGRKFWEENGSTTSMTFDMTAGSKSLQILNRLRQREGLEPVQGHHPEAAAHRKQKRLADVEQKNNQLIDSQYQKAMEGMDHQDPVVQDMAKILRGKVDEDYKAHSLRDQIHPYEAHKGIANKLPELVNAVKEPLAKAEEYGLDVSKIHERAKPGFRAAAVANGSTGVTRAYKEALDRELFEKQPQRLFHEVQNDVDQFMNRFHSLDKEKLRDEASKLFTGKVAQSRELGVFEEKQGQTGTPLRNHLAGLMREAYHDAEKSLRDQGGQPADQPGQSPVSPMLAQQERKAVVSDREHIHTPEFQNYFGDWKIDPENASQVTDTYGGREGKGQPIPVHHGTLKGGFSEFDPTKVSKDNLYGPGFYFTEDKGVADSYRDKGQHDLKDYKPAMSREEAVAKMREEMQEHIDRVKHPGDKAEWTEDLKKFEAAHPSWSDEEFKDFAYKNISHQTFNELYKAPQTDQTYKVYLNIRKPFDLSKPMSIEDGAALLSQIPKKFNPKGVVKDFVRSFTNTKTTPTGENIYSWLNESMKQDKATANKILQTSGYDGITHVGGNRMGGGHEHRVWIAFDPKQIKSVENQGTFDPAEKNIYKMEGHGEKVSGQDRVREFLKRAEEIQVTDDELPSTEDVDPRDYDEIEARMDSRQRRDMEEALAGYRDDYINQTIEHHGGIDEQEAANSVGLDRDSVEEKANEIFERHGLEPGEIGRRSYGPEAIQDLIKDLSNYDTEDEEVAASVEKVRAELEEWHSEAESDFETAKDRELDEWRDRIAEDYDNESDDKIEYLREFYRENEEMFAGSQEKGEHNKWHKDKDGDGLLTFETQSGSEYKVQAVYRTSDGETIPDLQFSDSSGGFGITGAGEAFQVFANVVPAMVSYIKGKDLEVATLSAAENSRRKLYDRLLKTVVSAVPGYFASYVDKGMHRHYVIGKEEARDAIIGNAEKRLGIPPKMLAGGTAANLMGSQSPQWADLKPEVNPEWFSEQGWQTGQPPAKRPQAPTLPQKPASEHHAALMGHAQKFLDADQTLTPEQKQGFGDAWNQAVGSLSKFAAQRANRHLEGVHFAPSWQEAMTKGYEETIAYGKANGKDPSELARLEQELEQIRTGSTAGAAMYSNWTNKIYTDGMEDGLASPADPEGHKGKNVLDIKLHELAHAVDGNRSMSGTKDWEVAWQTEMAGPKRTHDEPGDMAKLTRYAEANAHEGFAEFFRLVHTPGVDPKVIEQQFPRAADFFKKRQLWPHEEQGQASKGEPVLPDAPGGRATSFMGAETAGATGNNVEHARKEWLEKGTESPYFKKWFGESKIVDGEGKPLRVFHGTANDIESFDPDTQGKSTGGKIKGFYFTTSPKGSDRYAGFASMTSASPNAGQNTIPAFLSVKNPMVISLPHGDTRQADEFVAEAMKKGYDGLIVNNTLEGGGGFEKARVFVAFHPEQIKSATGNRGTFDPQDPNISRMEPQSPVQPMGWMGNIKKALGMGDKPDLAQHQETLRQTRPQLAKDLSSKMAVSTKPTKADSLNEVHEAKLDDGSTAYFKPLEEKEFEQGPRAGHNYTHGSQTQREWVAYKLAEMLGQHDLVPATAKTNIEVNGKPRVGSIQEAVKGDKGSFDSVGKLDKPTQLRAALFDLVTGNFDRHFGNFFVDKANHVHLIDNGFAFPDSTDKYHYDLRSYKDMLLNAVRQQTIPDYVQDWAKKAPQIASMLKENGMGDGAVKGVLTRLENLGKAVGKKVVQFSYPMDDGRMFRVSAMYTRDPSHWDMNHDPDAKTIIHPPARSQQEDKTE